MPERDGPRRILVYGVTGSGKTTLAAGIGERLGLPWHSVDDLTWEPGWVEVPKDVQRERIAAICAGPAWVLDSAYGSWLELPLRRADLIVCLDYPRWLSLGRLLRRTVRRMISRELVCNGNRESPGKVVARDSILVWHFRSYARKRDRMRAWAASTDGPPVVLLPTPRATEAWLHSLPAVPETEG
jgi:adenylate kinase family enzyme